MRFQLVDVMSLLWEFGRAKFVVNEGLDSCWDWKRVCLCNVIY